MLIIDDDPELDNILSGTSVDKHELIDLPMQQPCDSLHKHTRVN